MSIEAKITDAGQSVSTAATQTVTESVAIAPGGNLALNIAPEAVAAYSREGADLVIQLKSGETIRITNFYADPTKQSHLYLTEEEQLVAVDLSNPAASGSISASYVPQGAPAGFEAAAGAQGGSSGGIGLMAIAGLGALGGGIAIASSSGGGDGNNNSPTPPVHDTTPPAAATDLVISEDGDRISGSAEPGATVGIDTDGDGEADQTATVGNDGRFDVPLDTPLTNGETVTVIVTDTAGNDSPPASVIAPDSTAPEPAENVSVSSDGSSLSGTAEPGSTVGIDTDGDGEPDQAVVVGEDGSFTIPLDPPLTNGEPITVIVTDPAGNDSPPVNVAAPDNTAPDPAENVAISPDGTSLSGTAEPGATVGVDTDGDGEPDQTVVVGEDGGFTVPLNPPLTNGEQVEVTVTDPAGNDSPPVTVNAPDQPSAPTIDPSNGSVISGTAEPGLTVILTDGDGNPIGQTTVDSNGNWSFTPGSPLPDGTVVQAVAQDLTRLNSTPATMTVDGAAPPAPVIEPTNGDSLGGTAEAGSTVVITDGNGNPIGQATADGNGNWSFTPDTPLPDGTEVVVVARDAVGNESPEATTTVDAVAPAAPVIDPTNGSTISGTAEPGSTVTLTNGNGAAIGEATADGSGNWSFTPATALPDGTVVKATATDPAGNEGPEGTATVDGVAPLSPTVNLSDGSSLTGTAEPNSTVVITDGDGNPIAEVPADGSGNWSYTPGTPIPDGTEVVVVAQDAAGNQSPEATVTVDSSAPLPPAINPTNGSTISGTAEAGSTVTLTDGSNNPIGQVTADGSGNWSFTPGVSLPNGMVVKATATDPTGNTSPEATTTVDSVAPAAPVIDPTNGHAISGTTEPNATVTLTDGSDNPIGQATADGSGNWSFTPGTPLSDGTVVKATATDPAGNQGPEATATVDGIAPLSPTVNLSDGSSLTGTAEPNSTVVITDGDGNPIGQATADGSGNWSFTPGTPIPDGTEVIVLAQDAAGNQSPEATVTIDSSALPPVIEPTNGSVITGTAEANSTVTLVDGSDNPIGQVTADGSGNWSFTPGVPLPDGTVVKATVTDPTGNTSPEATTTVDGIAPPTPVIAPTNGDVVSGTAEPNATVTLVDGSDNPIGQATADGSGNWSFTPGTPLSDGTIVKATATDPAGNESGEATATVDGVAPNAPVIEPTNGSVIAGTAEANSTVTLVDGTNTPIGTAAVDGSGNWSFTPAIALPDGTVVKAIATDAAGNPSPETSATVDAVAPNAPIISISTDGSLLTGTAEPNSQVHIVIDGDTANPINVNVDGSGNFSLPFAPPLITGEPISAVAEDAAGNSSAAATINAPDLAPPTISVAEAVDTWINAAEISDGIQVTVDIRPTFQVGSVITVKFAGQNGYESEQTHSVTAGDIAAGSVIVTLEPPIAMGPFPEGASAITADIDGGTASTPVPFTIDTVAPATPVLSLVGSLLTISTEPGAELAVSVDVGGAVATETVTADNSGLASLNLLTDLDIDLSWDQLLNAQVSVAGADPAGNPSPVASLGVGTSIEQPVTIGNFGVDVSLNPLNPQFGFSGTTEPDSSVVIRVITPALNVELLPIQADSSGNFSLNLLSPTILTQLGLNITDILNLGSQISFNLVSTDANGNDSAAYGITLSPDGLSLNIGQIDINGTSGDDVLSGADGSSEHINGGAGHDLIFHTGTGDHVVAGDGNDTIQVVQTDFVSIDGGTGFDTLVLANGIDLDYNSVGVGTLSNIERVDLGTGDSGSVLTLTAAEVAAITDGNDTLQITGEANDTLNVVGAVDTGTTQLISGITYDVYTFGATTLLVEENTVQVVV